MAVVPVAAALSEGFLRPGRPWISTTFAAARTVGRTAASRASFPNPPCLPTSYGNSWKAGQAESCRPSACVLHQKTKGKTALCGANLRTPPEST